MQFNNCEQMRRQLLDNYLKNQQSHVSANVQDNNERSETFSDISRISSQYIRNNPQLTSQNNVEMMAIVPVQELPDNITIEDFTNLAKKWIEHDNWLRKYQELAKQKRKQKEKLTQIITHYMTKYNIEDLNTTEGKICCKVRHVKSGVNQKVVKEKITEIFKDNEETCNAIISKIFEDREKVERVSLRRIKISNI